MHEQRRPLRRYRRLTYSLGSTPRSEIDGGAPTLGTRIDSRVEIRAVRVTTRRAPRAISAGRRPCGGAPTAWSSRSPPAGAPNRLGHSVDTHFGHCNRRLNNAPLGLKRVRIACNITAHGAPPLPNAQPLTRCPPLPAGNPQGNGSCPATVSARPRWSSADRFRHHPRRQSVATETGGRRGRLSGPPQIRPRTYSYSMDTHHCSQPKRRRSVGLAATRLVACALSMAIVLGGCGGADLGPEDPTDTAVPSGAVSKPMTLPVAVGSARYDADPLSVVPSITAKLPNAEAQLNATPGNSAP